MRASMLCREATNADEPRELPARRYAGCKLLYLRFPIGSSLLRPSRTGMQPDWASMLYAMLAGGLSIAITLRLIRRGWTLRV